MNAVLKFSTSMCKCSNCNNPFGKRTDESAICEFKGTRKRARQPEQEMLRASGIKYMSRMGEQPHCGMWTAEEHYIILAIVEHVEIIKEPIDIANVTQLYQVIVDTVVKDCIPLSLAPKSARQINSKLRQLHKERQTAKVCGGTNYLPL